MKHVEITDLIKPAAKDVVLRPIGPTLAAELEIRRVIFKFLRIGAALARNRALPLYPQAVEELKTDAVVVTDSISGIGYFLQMFRAFQDYQVANLEPQIRNALIEEERRHRRALQESVRSATGVDLSNVLRASDVRAIVDASTLEIATLLHSVSNGLADRIGSRLLAAARKQTPRGEVAREAIAEQFQWGMTRTKLIVRDQVASFNSALTKARHAQIGVKQYVWSTALDERVRPAHAAREGKKYNWSQPPSDGHPGEPINCRCVARAVLGPNAIKRMF